MKLINFRIEQTLKNDLEAYASKKERTVASTIRFAIKKLIQEGK